MDNSIKAKISLEISRLDMLVEKSSVLLAKCNIEAPDFIELNAIGSVLHSYYSGLENIFKLIDKSLGGETLSGTMWHSDLLAHMFLKTEGHTAVLPQELLPPLKQYLGFRHVFRHAYSYELDWNRLQPLFAGMPQNWDAVRNSLQTFINK